MKVKSTVRPLPLMTDEYSVYINTNIIESQVGDETTMYEYEQQRYSKDEYMLYLNEQLTNAQLALVEMYESRGGDSNG